MKSPEKRNPTARTRRNYLALSDALYELMKIKEFNSVTVLEICEIAKVPRATFYNYFADKYDLLGYCFSGLADGIAAALADCPAGSQAYFEKLVDVVTEYMEKNRPVISKLFDADEGVCVTAIERMLCARFTENLLAAGRDFRLPVTLLGEFYAGSVIFVIKWWLENGASYEKREMADYIALLVDPTRFM